MSTTRFPDRRTADRLDIADTMYRYAEAMDHIGAHPIESLWTGYDNLLAVMRACLDGLSPDECHQVLAGTATRLYGLSADKFAVPPRRGSRSRSAAPAGQSGASAAPCRG